MNNLQLHLTTVMAAAAIALHTLAPAGRFLLAGYRAVCGFTFLHAPSGKDIYIGPDNHGQVLHIGGDGSVDAHLSAYFQFPSSTYVNSTPTATENVGIQTNSVGPHGIILNFTGGIYMGHTTY